jgi:hypothetical protein
LVDHLEYKKIEPLSGGAEGEKIMIIFASVMAVLLLISEGIMAHEQKDGSMFLVAMQVAAFAAACIWQQKWTALFSFALFSHRCLSSISSM